MHRIKFAGYSVRLPHHPVIRMVLGGCLVVLGLFGFLPILGFWMIPVGFVILSIDLPTVRRLRRKWAVAIGRWLRPRYPRLARVLGFAIPQPLE
jgi:hypothetical protein